MSEQRTSTAAEVIPGHMAPMRVAVHRSVPLERWQKIIDAVANIAADAGHKQQVVAANFLATHAPTPDEMASGDPYAAKTMLAGPEIVDGWVMHLGHLLGVPVELIPQAVQALLRVGETNAESTA